MSHITRRDFNRLSAAALSGLVAGAAVGCGDPAATPPAGAPTPDPASQGSADDAAALVGEDAAGLHNFLLSADHACRGLNQCKGQDKDGDNSCAGQGDCATIASHSCAGSNECKGQGGCGAAPGQNACKGKGGCSIPMHAGAWEKAREAFEARMKGESNEYGDAPAASG